MAKVGDKVPSATFKIMTKDGPKDVTTDDLFKGKKVAFFAVPGAFTPTCSAKHLPSFVQKNEDLKKKGIDSVICTAVNDVFVMDAWGKNQNVGEKVMMVADGAADFAEKMGLSLDLKARGLGTRSQRYSMLVEDGVIKKLNVEQGGGYEVSSAEHMLSQL